MKKTSKRVAFHNLGCKVNSYELDIMRQILRDEGYEEVPFQDRADIYVVNTCTVTNIADRKSRQMLHRAKKQNPDAVVVAVGCYVETDPDRVERDEAIDLVIGNDRKNRIGEILTDFLASRPETEEETSGKADRFEGMQLTSPGHTRAYIKIQDGCNQFCSYCIIPYARGRIHSRLPGDILREVRGLVETGVREVVLTGIHISSYGLDFDSEDDAPAVRRKPIPFDPEKAGRALLSLLRDLNAIEGLARIRLSSLEPRIMTEAFIQGLAKLEKICPHFHLSLQSGCDETLRRMNRHYTTAEYAQSVRLLRRYYDRPAITTDVIVGFPGETEAEFAQTCAFLEEIRFYEIHVFRYSRRRGTAADKMKYQIPEPVKAVRSDRLLALTAAQAREFRAQFAGEEETILLEEICRRDTEEYWTGSTARYVTGAVPAAASENDGAGRAGTDQNRAGCTGVDQNRAGRAGTDQNRAGCTGVDQDRTDSATAPAFAPGMLLRGRFSGETVRLSRGECMRFDPFGGR